MGESLKVIALISGGKDSFFSIFHCIQNGHEVVALGNLYPPAPPQKSYSDALSQDNGGAAEDEQDLNSFMYQTVGHAVIPLYETALGIPLYRQQILGSAVQTGTSYNHDTVLAISSSSETMSQDQNEDETESLVPLLKKILAQHPEANALSTGAILSTYQRTRIESVALRLGLTPLSYLWQYPTLPPGTQTSLLSDMQDVGLDARIVKVASGGLDESFLWENVASELGIRRVEKAMKRFGVDGDGGVLGEGGEFETLVVDGPRSLFKGRIEIREEDRRVVRECGGAAWLSVLDAKVVMKAHETEDTVCRVPENLEQRFKHILDSLGSAVETEPVGKTYSTSQAFLSSPLVDLSMVVTKSSDLSNFTANQNETLYWTVYGRRRYASHGIADEAGEAILQIRQFLQHASFEPTSIVSTTIILRSMQDFAAVNSCYGSLFTAPNPPSRVTISCGSLLPKETNILIHLKITASPPSISSQKALHVQSRSYWAPANIGPYSQATSISISSTADTESDIAIVSIAGQIPLIPSSMVLPPVSPDLNILENYKFQTVLSLQHLFRIGTAMSVSWFAGTVAYLPTSQNKIAPMLPTVQRARIAGQAWKRIHARPEPTDDEDDEEPRDLWEEKYHAGLRTMSRETELKSIPDWDVVSFESQEAGQIGIPSFWAAEVEELPRGAGIEWAALSGVAGSSVKLSSKLNEGRWLIERCWFGNVVQSFVQILYSDDVAVVQEVEKALDSVGLEAGAGAIASWLDLSIEGIGNFFNSKTHGGVVPCRSLWDVDGRRLAVVLVFESIV